MACAARNKCSAWLISAAIGAVAGRPQVTGARDGDSGMVRRRREERHTEFAVYRSENVRMNAIVVTQNTMSPFNCLNLWRLALLAALVSAVAAETNPPSIGAQLISEGKTAPVPPALTSAPPAPTVPPSPTAGAAPSPGVDVRPTVELVDATDPTMPPATPPVIDASAIRRRRGGKRSKSSATIDQPAGGGATARKPLPRQPQIVGSSAESSAPNQPTRHVLGESGSSEGFEEETSPNSVGAVIVDEATVAAEALHMPFVYSFVALVVITLVAGRKIVAAWFKRDFWTNPIVSTGAGGIPSNADRPLRTLPRAALSEGVASRKQPMEVDPSGTTPEAEPLTQTPSGSGADSFAGSGSSSGGGGGGGMFFTDSANNAASVMLTKEHVLRLMGALPTRFGCKDWRLLYSTPEHGTSLAQFYRRVKQQGPTLTVIQACVFFVFFRM